MRQATRLCDRCGNACIEGGAVIAVDAGRLRRQFPDALDLCDDCSAAFVSFMRAPRQASQDGIGEPLAATVVCSMALA